MANRQYPVPFASSPGSGGGGGSGTVTSVGLAVNGTNPSGIFTVTGSPVTTSGTLNINLAGTSGGVPYFSDGTTLSSSGALASNAVVLGGGAGASPKTVAGFTTDGTSQFTLGVATSSTGALKLTGSGSGTATITAQAAAGTPTLTLPNASGTFAVSATAPLVLSATTGALTYTPINTTGSYVFSHPIYPTTTTTNSVFVASGNQVILTPITIWNDITINKVTINVTTLQAASTVTVGLYSMDGTTKILDSGTFDSSTTGFKTNTVGTVTISKGGYLFAHSTSNSAVQCSTVSSDATRNGFLNAVATKQGSAANSVSAGVLPSSTGVISALSSTTVITKFET